MTELKIILTLIGTTLGALLGGFDTMLTTLIIFVVIDYITGVMKGFANKTLSSEIGFKGIFGKITIFLIVAIATSLDMIMGLDVIRYLAIAFYIANEGISILENASELGLPVPKKIQDILIQLKNESESDSNE